MGFNGPGCGFSKPGLSAHLYSASLPEAVYQYQVPILSPVTSDLLFLNQWKRDFFPRKNVQDARFYLGTAAHEAGTLLTKLWHPAH